MLMPFFTKHEIESIAKVCHDANKAYCETLGDRSQFPWELAPDWQRDSAMNGVEFHLLFPDAPASQSHENWRLGKVATGWVYGEVKDAEAKTHPCLVPFEDLPREQQLKDYLFKAIVGALAPRKEA